MLSIREMIQKGGLSLLDLIYPIQCATCEEWMGAEEKGGLCLGCLSQIPKNTPPFCLSCGRQYVGTEDAPRCGACEGKRFSFDRLWFAAPYAGVLREALHAFKYKRKRTLAHSLGEFLATFAKENLLHVPFDDVLPVPLYRKRERERQFNQSALLAKAVAEALALPLSLENLVRVRHTLPQVDLPKSRRLDNIQGAFRVKDPSRFVEKRLLLIDDVVTTGATLSACADALRETGASHVSVLTLTRG